MGAVTLEIRLRDWGPAESVSRERIEAAAGLPAAETGSRLQHLVAVAPTWGDQIEIRASARVGQMQLGRLLVDVRPRLGVGQTIALIGWVHRVDIAIAEDALGAGAASPYRLEQALAAALVGEARHILETEIHRAYVSRRETLLIPRGRPNFSRMSPATAHAGIPCTFHEITRATLPNGLLRAALERALALLLDTPTEHDARRAMEAFASLTPPAVPSDTLFLAALDVLSERWEAYRPALVLARYLLLGGAPQGAVGAGGVRGWSVDMADLFEKAVGRAVRDWANRHSLGVREQAAHRDQIHDGLGRSYAPFYPDLEVHRQGRVVAILDAKYKPYAEAHDSGAPRRKVDSSDLYQLAFYVAAAAARDTAVAGVIVCPAATRETRLAEAFRKLSLGGQRLEIAPLDLRQCLASGSDPAFSARLDELGRSWGPVGLPGQP